MNLGFVSTKNWFAVSTERVCGHRNWELVSTACVHCVHKNPIRCVHMCPQMNTLNIDPIAKEKSFLPDILGVVLALGILMATSITN